MSWEWVAPVATAAVGIAGIAATWLSARLGRADQHSLIIVQQQHAVDMALREMRRKAYVEFISNVYGITSMTAAARNETEGLRGLDAVHDLTRALAEVRILGSDAVRELAPKVAKDTLSFQALLFESKPTGAMDKAAGKEFGDRRARLEMLMAADLGIMAQLSPGNITQSLTTIPDSSEVSQPSTGEAPDK